MNKEFDFLSIRLTAFLFPAMLIATSLKYGVVYLSIGMGDKSMALTLFLNMTGPALFFYLLELLITIGLFVNLFRLAEIESRWNAASILLMACLISEVLTRVLEWQLSYLEKSAPGQSVAIITSVIPELLRYSGLIVFLAGVSRTRWKMRNGGKKEIDKKGLRIFQRWCACAGILILSVPVFQLVLILTDYYSLELVKWIGLVEAVFCLCMSIPMGLREVSFCQEYYLYRYNRG